MLIENLKFKIMEMLFALSIFTIVFIYIMIIFAPEIAQNKIVRIIMFVAVCLLILSAYFIE